MKYNLSHRQLLELKRINSPTIANAIELCKLRPRLEGVNRDETRDFMPHMGPMIGYAVTGTFLASRRPRPGQKNLTLDLFEAMERAPKPAIVVIQDLDSPKGVVGSFWGECNSNMLHALGAVGTITDGAIRDYNEMLNAGVHAIARRLCVSHAYGRLVSVNKPVKVFGTKIRPGELVHADQHGFITIPPRGAERIVDAARHMDRCEMEYLIGPSRSGDFSSQRFRKLVPAFDAAMVKFAGDLVEGEWGGRRR